MNAFVGEMKSYDWFKWACDAGICVPDDKVYRIILDIGIEDVVRVYVGKYPPDAKASQPFPNACDAKRFRQIEISPVDVVSELISCGPPTKAELPSDT